MSCSSLDLKAYLFGELSEADRKMVEAHAETCESCREELARLRLTHETLSALREEEVPQRIAFVSDKVFEPKWWQSLWNSAPRLGFVSASLLAAAILIHTFARPPIAVVQGSEAAALEARVEQQVGQRLDAAVRQAVADSEARQEKKTAELLDTANQNYDRDRRETLAAMQRDDYNMLYKKAAIFIKKTNGIN